MSSTPMFFRILNPIMKAMLKSPLHSSVSGRIMIITFKGRKSGKEYSTPVSYFKENGKVYCFTHGSWWRNIKDGAQVKVRILGKDHQGLAETVSEDAELKSTYLAKMLKAIPSDARYYGVTLDANGDPNIEEVNRAVADIVMIRTSLKA